MFIFKTLLGLLLFVVIFVIVVGIFIILRFGSFLRMLFGKKGQNGYDSVYRGGNTRDNTKSDEPTISGQPKPRNSEFDKNEGEYVDFEELP